MAKHLREIANSSTPKMPKEGEYSGVNKSKTEPVDVSDLNASTGNNDFAKKHKIEKHADRVGNGEDVYAASKIKTAPYKKQDQKVYESWMKCESCGKSYEGESCGCNGKAVKAAVPNGGKGLIADKKKLEEVLTKKTSAGKMIDDFVHSNNPKFDGKSKEKRTKMALGAYYAMHPEKSKNEEVEQIDEISKELALAHNQAAGDQREKALKTGEMPRVNPHSSKKRSTLQRHLDGMQMSYNKLTGAARVPANEEVEQIDEISDKLALATAKGAAQSMDTADVNTDKGFNTFQKRMKTHALALDKMNPPHKRLKAKVGTTEANAKEKKYQDAIKEEDQIDETSDAYKKNYADAAQTDVKKKTSDAMDAQRVGDDSTMMSLLKKVAQRKTNINKAVGPSKTTYNEDLAMPMLEGGKKKKTQKESAPGDTPIRMPSGNVGDSDTGRI